MVGDARTGSALRLPASHRAVAPPSPPSALLAFLVLAASMPAPSRRRRPLWFCCFLLLLSLLSFLSDPLFDCSFFFSSSPSHPLFPGLVLDLVLPMLGVRGQEPGQATRPGGTWRRHGRAIRRAVRVWIRPVGCADGHVSAVDLLPHAR